MRLFMLAVFLASCWGMVQSSQPSLADLSKQARERKAKALKPGRLITNADLKDFQNAPVSVSKAAEKATPSEETKAAEVKAPASSEDTEYAKLLGEWRPKFQAVVIDYKNAVNRALVLQLRQKYVYDSAHTPDPTVHLWFAAEFERTTKEIESNKEEVTKAEKAIEALKVEAGAAGLREGDIAAMIGELPKPTSTDLETPEPSESR